MFAQTVVMCMAFKTPCIRLSFISFSVVKCVELDESIYMEQVVLDEEGAKLSFLGCSTDCVSWNTQSQLCG